MLEQHLDWIGRRFRFISLDELGARLDARTAARIRSRQSHLTMATAISTTMRCPLLKRKGIPAAVFVVTDLVGTKARANPRQLYLLLARRFSPKSGAPTPFQATRALLERCPRLR
jgi:hypothetical protein